MFLENMNFFGYEPKKYPDIWNLDFKNIHLIHIQQNGFM